MAKKRGRNASLNGAYNEESFIGLLECAGYHYTKKHIPDVKEYNQQSWFSHPWGKRGQSDCMLQTSGGKIVLVQNKNQNVSGTVDEKIPFQFDIARWTLFDIKFDEFWLVLGGTYWRTDSGKLRIAAYKRKGVESDGMTQGRMISRVLLQPSKELVYCITGEK